MKIINKFILGVALAIGLSSCEGLDVKPKGFYSDENFYKSIDDAQTALYYAYDALTLTSYAPVTYYFTELASDNCNVKQDEGADALAFMNWEVNSQNELLSQYYRCAYIAINRANAVLENTEGRGFDQEQVDRITGEAYFLRAYNHFNVVRAFGLVPLQKQLVDELEETNAPLPRDMDEVYTFLIDDLTQAIERLDVNRVTGCADKVAAQALLSKVYLFAASAKENGVPKYDAISTSVDELYASAAQYSNAVLTEQSEYAHDTNLQNIYDVEAPDGDEHIFILSYNRSGTQEGDYSKLSKYFIPWVAGGDIYLKNTDDTYFKSHDGWSVFQTTDDLIQTLGTDDKRRTDLLVSEIFDGENKSLGTVGNGVVLYEFTRKYIDPEFEGDKTSTRPYLLRYSDIQLVYAESAANDEGLAQLNQIRTRAGLEELTSVGDKTAFRKLVLEERQKELAFEGDRLWDLRRTNSVQTEVTEAAGLSPENLAFYPLPQREVDLNPNID